MEEPYESLSWINESGSLKVIKRNGKRLTDEVIQNAKISRKATV